MTPPPPETPAYADVPRAPLRTFLGWLLIVAAGALFVYMWRTTFHLPAADPFRPAGWDPRLPAEKNGIRRVDGVGGGLNGVFALRGGEEIWAVGAGGLILRSTDRGASWDKMEVPFPGDSARAREAPGGGDAPGAAGRGFVSGLRAVHFRDERYGWIVGSEVVLRTTDGGSRWASARVEAKFTSVSFPALDAGWATGGGLLYRSVDGGAAWERAEQQPARPVRSVQFTTPDRGWAVAADSGALFRTSDGGFTWPSVPVRERARTRITAAAFSGVLRGWVALAPDSAGGAALLRTEDGGDNWHPAAGAPRSAVSALHFPDSSGVGWAATVDGEIHRTEDGGRTWTTAETGGVRLPLTALHFAGHEQGFAVGADGGILVTHDGGRVWRVAAADARMLADLDFVGRRGWAVGRKGTVSRSEDGGKSWTMLPPAADADLAAVEFISGDSGWVVGRGGTLRSTEDGGRTWRTPHVEPVPPPDSVTLHDVAFVGQSGWAVGSHGTVLTTENGGMTWVRRDREDRAALRAVRFADDTLGWAIAGEVVLRSVDGGVSWTEAGRSPLGRLTALDVGCVGERRARRCVARAAGPDGLWLVARDGGSFQLVPSAISSQVLAVDFADTAAGWAAGRRGGLWRTDDGATWKSVSTGSQADLYALVAGSKLEAWALGEGGTVLGTADGTHWAQVAQRTRLRPAALQIAGWLAALGLALWGVLTLNSRPPRPEIEHLLLSDRPLRPGDHDVLRLGPLAHGLSGFLRNSRTRPPLTIAVTGPWGSGKSSLMNLVYEDLRRRKFRPVRFNAWHHRGDEQLLASLFETIRATAVQPGLSLVGFAFRVRLFVLRLQQKASSARLALLLAVILAAFFVSGGGRLAAFGEGLTALAGALEGRAPGVSGAGAAVGLTVAVAAVVSFAKALTPFGVKPAALLASAARGISLRSLSAQAGFRHHFARDFGQVTRALGHRPLVIFIDDLDRCPAERVLEVLEAVNFLVSSGECFVVMGMDRQRVAAFLAEEFKDRLPEGGESDSDFVEEYLQKLISLEVPVPPTGPAQRMHLLLPAAKRRWKSRTVRMVRWLELATRPIRPGFWYTLLLMATFYAVFTLTRPDGPVSPPEVKVSSEPAPGGQAEPLNATPVMRGDSLAGALEEETRGPAGLSDNPEPSREWRHLVLALLLATALAGYGVLTRPEIRVKDSDEFLAALKVWAEYIAGGNGSPRAVKKFLNRLRFHAMRMRMHGGAPGRLDRFSEWLEGWRRGGSSPRAGAADGGSGTAAPGASADAARQPVIPDAVLVALAAIEERRPEDLQELLAPDGGEPGPTEKLLRDKLAETAAELGDTPAARSLKALLEPATAPAAGAEDGQPPRDSIEEMLAAGCREYMKISRPTYRATGGAGTRGVLPLAPIAAGDGAAARDDGIARV